SNEECPPHSLVLPGTAVAAIRSVSLSFGRPDWTTANAQVAGEPAIRTAWTGADEEDMALEVRLPGTFGILEIETAIRGPDRAALRTTLARWLAGVRIDLPHLPVGTTDVVAASAVKTALATLLSQNPGSDFYACFASGLGSHSALVASDQNALPLSRPHQATCTATVKRNSEFELWIVDLAATWADRRAGELRGLEDVLWINALGGVISVEHRSLSAPGSSPGM
ncbi:MAG TPA: hypothetical protein VFP19_06545, partial [Candidatus Limnocylindrales bacterium]|nr:hypothetical protein [Candidatus Limnocylindrales bacterium]